MKIRSNLPADLGSIGNEWHAGIPADVQEDGYFTFESQGDDYAPQGLPSWVSMHPGIVELTEVADARFRERHDVDPSQQTEHYVSLRSGVGNTVAYHQLLPGSLRWVPYTPKDLHPSLVHADILTTDDLPDEDTPSDMYTVTSREPTEWFAGEFFLPRPPNKSKHKIIDDAYAATYTAVMGACLRAQVDTSEAWVGEENHLLLASQTDVHRMGSVQDVTRKRRVFFRDYVEVTPDTSLE